MKADVSGTRAASLEPGVFRAVNPIKYVMPPKRLVFAERIQDRFNESTQKFRQLHRIKFHKYPSREFALLSVYSPFTGKVPTVLEQYSLKSDLNTFRIVQG